MTTEKHKHISFHNGHITWKGNNKPSPEIMEAFEAMYQFIQEHEKEISKLRNKNAVYGPIDRDKFNF